MLSCLADASYIRACASARFCDRCIVPIDVPCIVQLYVHVWVRHSVQGQLLLWAAKGGLFPHIGGVESHRGLSLCIGIVSSSVSKLNLIILWSKWLSSLLTFQPFSLARVGSLIPCWSGFE